MAATSAGILPYRVAADGTVSALVAHMGGPYWASRDEGAWSIVKGEFDAEGETARDAARREFREELGLDPPGGEYAELGTFAYASGKRITVFVVDGAGFDVTPARFGEFEMEWPPRSGRRASFPEVDRVAWLSLDDARTRLVRGQRPALDRLAKLLGAI
ncbi:NUDIX domain-containing protein [Microbacterium oleivorans]|uniref:NUDIX domain-containing protein n=1 Tax=Microbacterium oleivorans TaxID=273677 RepID=A0A7D5EWP4_9MICO|nr:NUDIX domain-containing protein [Microbacterium oleivorans]QLD11524.1 NUDIX domain-containing protein [Microbacterium oleivorans]